MMRCGMRIVPLAWERSARARLVADGLLCARCTRESRTTVLAAPDRSALCRFAVGDDEIPEGWSARHAAAHRRLLARFIRHHLAEGRGFTALDFWETPSWTSTS